MWPPDFNNHDIYENKSQEKLLLLLKSNLLRALTFEDVRSSMGELLKS